MKTNLSDSLFSLTAKANYHYYNVRKWYLSVNWLKLIVLGTIFTAGCTLAIMVFFQIASLIR